MKTMMVMSAGLAAATLNAAPLMTEWGEKVTSENCWRDYPRPQLVRANWTCLNGDWDYAITSVTNTPGRPTKWEGKIRVPYPIESALSGVGRKLEEGEFLWYTRTIDIEKKFGERILLHFDGVDFRAMVFIGHKEVTDVPHAGAQEPFTLDITDFVERGPNELTVCVWDPTEGFINSRGKQSRQPRGCYYTRASGIWQSVWMERVPATHIRDYRVTADVKRGEALLAFDVASPLFAKDEVTVEVAGVRKTTRNGRVAIRLPSPVRLWSPETPNLYTFTATCGSDRITGYFGMRKFEKRRDAKGVLRFYLNDRPTFILGTLDQGWWPDGLLTPPSEAAMRHDIQTLKDCGFNMMRKHIKVEPRRYYYLCDTMGLLVLQDLPSNAPGWNQYLKDGTVRDSGFQRLELRRMLDCLQKVPSIVMWIPYNEGWTQPGEFLTHSTLDFVKRYDPTRLVDGPSGSNDFEGGQVLVNGWAWKARVETEHKPADVCEAGDAVDLHLYRSDYPDGIHGHCRMLPVNGRRVSFLGEFGGLGHAVAGHLYNESSRSWGYGGLEDTKTPEGLEKTYLTLTDDLAALAEQGLGGSVYTQTTDVETEINGLMTYDRKVLKLSPRVLKAAHEKVLRAAEAAATQPRPYYKTDYKPVLGDRMWLWGHDGDSLKEGLNYNIDRKSHLGMKEAADFVGIPNVAVVRWKGLPKTPFGSYFDEFPKLRRFAWGVMSADDQTPFDESVRLAMEMCRKYPNLTTLQFDDYFVNNNTRALVEIQHVRDEVAKLDQKRPLSCVYYEHNIRDLAKHKPQLDLFDEVSFWTWKPENLKDEEANVRKMRAALGPERRLYVGVYLWDYDKQRELAPEYMKRQLETTLGLIKSGVADGLIVCASYLLDTDYPSVKIFREWVKENANTPVSMPLADLTGERDSQVVLAFDPRPLMAVTAMMLSKKVD